MKKLLIGLGFAAAALLEGCGSSGNSASMAGAANTGNGALFQVGAAVVNIDPPAPVTVGGYSDKGKPAIQQSNDPLQVRAFVVAREGKAVAFAVVDSTGWFAEYQENESGYGQFGARVDAAKKLNARGLAADRSAVMVSTTHSHATPTVVGIWGNMTPANRAYVKQLHDAVVEAVDKAAANMKTSELWFANGDISSIIWQNGQGTDHVDGYAVDAKMPVLWARDPDTGATNALFVTIPNHPDQFRPFNGDVTQGFSADVPGYVRKMMDDSIAGVAVVGSGTLGRQESPGRDSTYAEVTRQGDYVGNAIRLAMAKATPITATNIASAEQLIQVSVGSTAGNQGLLALMKYNASAGPFGGPSCNSALGGNCSIPRALSAPWCQGNCGLTGSGATTLSTYVTALRIGGLLYVSNPSEAFPEVNAAIRSGVLDAQSVNPVGLAGDFLGYNWVPSDYTSLQFGSGDFEKYNVGPDLAQKTADAGYTSANALGFKVKAAPDVVHAVSDPTGLAAVSTGITLPGVQFYPSQIEGGNLKINFYGATAQPQSNFKQTAHALSAISWSFGDSSSGTTNDGDRFDHVYGQPGSYRVVATVVDNTSGLKRSWEQQLRIDAPLSVSISAFTDSVGKKKLTLQFAGGQGTLLGAAWTCPNGDVVRGLTVSCAAGTGAIKVSAIDGGGNLAQATASAAILQ